jgi:coenzyme PQQ precursor peptide PqqA
LRNHGSLDAGFIASTIGTDLLAQHHGDGPVVSLAGLAFTDQPEEFDMQWIDPAYADIRLGFEVTAYVYVR